MLTDGNYPVRVLKADRNGDVPPPGDSKRKQGFYQQQTHFEFYFAEDVAPSGDKPNLIVIWDATRSFALVELRVACPRYGDETRTNVQMHWVERLPHPADTYLVPADDLSGDEVEDVEGIEPIDTALTGSGGDSSGNE